MRLFVLLSFLLLGLRASSSAVENPIPENSRQLVLVVAPSWNASVGTLQCFTRESAQVAWTAIGEPCRAKLGKKGLAWGLGLHVPVEGAKAKREGDLRAPAGVFRWGTAFGFGPAKTHGTLALPYFEISPDAEAIDDPASRYYNQLVRRKQIAEPDWKSSEKMPSIAVYELGAVILHNPRNEPGKGSCIFLHDWGTGSGGTAGCTALKRPDLERVIRWLDPRKEPALIQVPESERARFGF